MDKNSYGLQIITFGICALKQKMSFLLLCFKAEMKLINDMTTEDRKEIDELDEQIAAVEKDEKQLVEQLVECRRKKKRLVERKALLLGNDFRDFDRKSIPDLLEILFRKHGKLHINDAAKLMKSEFGRAVATQTISGALIRYVQKGKRFKQLGNNIFELAGDGQID